MRPRAKNRVGSSAVFSDTNSHVPAPQPVRLLLRAVVGVVCVLALAAVVWIYWPPGPGGAPSANSLPAGPQPSPSKPAESPGQRSPGATIRLSATPLALPAEQLQRETEEVGSQLLARFPELPEALHVAALMHAQLRQTAQAQKLWQRCVELMPRNDQYRINLAAIAMDHGDYDLAVAALQPAIERGSTSPEVSHHLGMALSQLGRGEEAEQILSASLQRHPQSTAHWLVLGQAQLKSGKASEAETSLRQALALGLESSDLYFALGNACAQLGKREEAAEFHQQFALRQAAQPLAAQERFQVLSTAEARRTAVTIMVEAATVHAWQQDSLEAERLLLRALAIDPSSLASCRKLAEIYKEAGLVAEQRAAVLRLVEIDPHNLIHYLELAQLEARLDEPEAAEAALKMAISVAPDNAAPYTTLARFCLQEKQTKKARWYAQEAVRRNPTPEGYVLLASICRLVSDEPTAEAALAEAQRLASSKGAKPPEKAPQKLDE